MEDQLHPKILESIVCTLSRPRKMTVFNFLDALLKPFRCWVAAHFADQKIQIPYVSFIHLKLDHFNMYVKS